jgi:hypothetical protein
MNINKYFYFLRRFFYYFYGEKFYKRLNYNWESFPNRTKILQEIIEYKTSSSYLEIGCDLDENFSKINLLDKIGVDPKSGGTHRMTSDQFFLQNDKKFDLIYIDGLHTYEQAIKDINNSIKFLNQKGLIVIHDCLPKKIWNQIVPRMHGHWNGDVWKAIVEVRTWKNFETFTIIADHGLAVIQQKPNSNVLKYNKKNFGKLTFKEYFTNHKNFMNPIEYKNYKNLI